MNEPKTVRSESELKLTSNSDLLFDKQKQDVADMRASLLSFSQDTDPLSAKYAMQRITVMRVYHQISRIIKYTEMMDKIEEKLYESIDKALDSMNTDSPSTWITLLNIQEKLQKSMIESHKLLQPYLDPELFSSVTIIQAPETEPDYQKMLIDQDSREKIRTGAQSVLAAIQGLDVQEGRNG